MRYKVIMKFGGADLGIPKYIDEATDIVISNMSRNPIVVPSAVGSCDVYPVKTTNLLLQIADTRNSDRQRKKLLETVISRHRQIISDLGLNDTLLDDDFEALEKYFKSPKDYPPKEYADLLAAFGELISSKIVADVQSKKGYPSIAIDAADIGFVTTSRFGDANILDSSYGEIRESLNSLSQKTKECPIVTGYIGKGKKGKRTTLGRGGSDYTAVILGAAAKTNVEVWKKVKGFLTVIPEFIEKPNVIDELSYAEAEELGRHGAKVLQGKTISAARKRTGLKIWVKDIDEPENPGTLITSGRKKEGVVKAITYCDVDVLRTYPRTYDQKAVLTNILAARDNIEVLADSFTTGDPGYALFVVRDPSHSIGNVLREKTGIKVGGETDKRMIKLVGDGIGDNQEIKERAHRALVKVQEYFSTQTVFHVVYRLEPTTGTSIGFVVRKRALEGAVKALYREFFPEDAE
jgi:aspartate kinase